MPIDPSTSLDPGDIFWVVLPKQGGSEQHGRRRCIIMSRRIINRGNPIVVVPMTTNMARATSYNIALPKFEIIKDVSCLSEIQDSVALCSQVRAIDKAAIENKIGKLSQSAVLAVQLGLAYIFDIR